MDAITRCLTPGTHNNLRTMHIFWYTFEIFHLKTSVILFVELTWEQNVNVISHDDVIKWKHFPLALCEGNPEVTGEFPSQSPVTRGFDIFIDLRLNKQFSKQSRHWWFETPLRSLWRHCKDTGRFVWTFQLFSMSLPTGLNVEWLQKMI